MIRILKFLLTGDWHLHIWETVRYVQADDYLGRTWTRYYCKCKICGTHKRFD